LTAGLVELRYNLGDATRVLTAAQPVDLSGRTWHAVRAGRVGRRGFLSLDGKEARPRDGDAPPGTMTTLDVATDVFVGGVSTPSQVARDATRDGALTGFTGGVRQLAINDRELPLTETGALDGVNVGDWDGTACGYEVCRNGGSCRATEEGSFACACPPAWTGALCERPVACEDHLCRQGSVCAPSPDGGGGRGSSPYVCLCPLGWGGRCCESCAFRRPALTTQRSVKKAGLLSWFNFLLRETPARHRLTLIGLSPLFFFFYISSSSLVSVRFLHRRSTPL
jgi:EYS protein